MLGLGLGVGILGIGIGMGLIGNGALQGMARQPDAMPKLMIQMIIAMAFVELVFLLTLFLSPGMFGGK